MFYKWFNMPKKWEDIENRIVIEADGKRDYFIDPITGNETSNAPYYAKKIYGNFTFSCKLKPEFNERYDAGAILLHNVLDNWAKVAFELTEIGHKGVASVITKGASDDANGEEIDVDEVWLKMTRKVDVYALYYSLDNCNWRIVRYFRLNKADDCDLYLGVEAQSPIGKGCRVEFSDFSFSDNTVSDISKGI